MTPREILTQSLSLLTITDEIEGPKQSQLDKAFPRFVSMIKEEFTSQSYDFMRETVEHTLAAVSTPKETLTIGTSGDVAVDALDVTWMGRSGTKGNYVTMTELSESDWHHLRSSSQGKGMPIQYYVTKRKDLSLEIFLWQRQSLLTYLEITYRRRIAMPANLDADLDIPDDWQKALEYAMAVELRPVFGVPLDSVQDVFALAGIATKKIRGWSAANSYIRFKRS